ncbi:MAG: hypothetical protein ACOCU6_01380 [Nanoarchaeota archaeon]
MKPMLRRLLLIELIILFIYCIGVMILDLSLALGTFHGLLFSLLTLYFSILVFMVNSVIAIVNTLKKRTIAAKHYIIAGMITTGAGCLIAFVIPHVFF